MTLSLREVARGRWRGILPAFGVDPKLLNGKQGPCPMCGGKTRFRFDDREGRGSWICNHCGAGDGVQLVLMKTGLPFADIAKRIEQEAGVAPRVENKTAQTPEQQREARKALWQASKPVTTGDPVDRWLRFRVGGVVVPKVIRCAERCRYQDDPPSWHPAMIAAMQAPDGSVTTLHRTYLTPDGRKANVAAPRRNMKGLIADGSAVRLMPHVEVLGVGEGIENAFAASILFKVPVWATLNEVLLAKWVPPARVSRVIVFADNDANYVGQSAAYMLARRLANAGVSASVEVPPSVGTDWNDVLMEQAA